jgi:hypothetical protein
VALETSTALQRLSNIAFRKFSAKSDTAFIVPCKELYGIIFHLRNNQISWNYSIERQYYEPNFSRGDLIRNDWASRLSSKVAKL